MLRDRLITAMFTLARLRFILTRPLTMGVRVLLVRDGQVLLIKHVYLRDWYLPGGGVDKNETVEQAARRECREEVGADIGALQLHGVYSNFAQHKSDHVVVFVAQDFTIGPRESRFEIREQRFFPLRALPAGVSPGTARRIEEYLEDTGQACCGRW